MPARRHPANRSPVRGVELIAERPDGTRSWVLPYPTPLMDAAGTLTGAVNVLVDITDRKQMEEERERLLAAEQRARERADAAVRARDEFMAIASHELRNPIASIKGTAQLLQRAVDRDRLTAEDAGRYAAVIAATGDRLAHLVDDLLDVARLESGRLRLRTQPVDLPALVGEIAREQVGGRRRLLFTEMDPGTPAALADPDRVRQILENLLDNAVKYSPEDGEVACRLRSPIAWRAFASATVASASQPERWS